MDFFSLLLLKPGSFQWAKNFLNSPTWDAISKLSNGHSFSFSLPASSPSVRITNYSCSDPPEPVSIDLEEIENEETQAVEKEATVENSDRLTGKQPMHPSSEAVTPPPSASLPAHTQRAKHGKAIILSETSLRRSTRIHNNTKGF